MIFNVNATIITPTHIGMGMEKRLLSGIDFKYDKRNGEYLVFSGNKLLQSIGKHEVSVVSGFLANGNYEAFAAYLEKHNLLNDTSIKYRWMTQFGSAPEIRQAFMDGAGKYFVPGSAIKGSLRSIIGTKLWHGRNTPIRYDELMGKIDNNLMRFFQVTDCYFNETTHPGIYPVKVFSADRGAGAGYGTWKDQPKGGHNRSFDNRRFVTFYEMLSDGLNSPETNGSFRVNWGGEKFIRDRRRQDIPNLAIFDDPASLGWLWSAVRENTNHLLDRELHFFKSYPNEAIDDSFFDELAWIREQNNENENVCVLRLGANVGWHSITGNWRFTDHVTAVEENRGQKVGGRELAFKTRKLGFDTLDDGKRRFFLPGFVKLSIE